MSTLIMSLSSGKGTWAEVAKIMNECQFEDIILITNSFGKEKFSHTKKFETIVLEDNLSVTKMRDKIKESLKIKDSEVAVNLTSGNGKEHMAIISALIQSGLGLRLVTLTKEGVKEI